MPNVRRAVLLAAGAGCIMLGTLFGWASRSLTAREALESADSRDAPSRAFWTSPLFLRGSPDKTLKDSRIHPSASAMTSRAHPTVLLDLGSAFSATNAVGAMHAIHGVGRDNADNAEGGTDSGGERAGPESAADWSDVGTERPGTIPSTRDGRWAHSRGLLQLSLEYDGRTERRPWGACEEGRALREIL